MAAPSIILLFMHENSLTHSKGGFENHPCVSERAETRLLKN